ncbi:MAG: hypothetical protein N3A53_02670, partial [Verrucomicrobiae bacterium]|nr:hypothetical protein [Verrucomicrobiae bacterium]
ATLRLELGSALTPGITYDQLAMTGSVVPSTPTGWWVDESIQTVRLPTLRRGRHTLVLTLPYTRHSGLEWCYLLGDFGVALAGRHARIIPPVRQLVFGDWVSQGLPFYTGNVTYHASLVGNGRRLALQFHWPRGLHVQLVDLIEQLWANALPQTRVPLVGVQLDGKPVGHVAFAPFRIDLGRVTKGRHQLDLTCYGHRYNAFGAVHNLNHEHLWAEAAPDAWRTTGRDWSYEYQLRPMGLLTAPVILAH